MDSNTIIDAVLDGAADDNLNGISQAVRQREKTVATRNAAKMKRGDSVRLCGNLSPKYLVGLEGTVDGPAVSSRIPVMLGEADADIAHRFGNPIRVPVACVEAIG